MPHHPALLVERMSAHRQAQLRVLRQQSNQLQPVTALLRRTVERAAAQEVAGLFRDRGAPAHIQRSGLAIGVDAHLEKPLFDAQPIERLHPQGPNAVRSSSCSNRSHNSSARSAAMSSS